jgi:acetolactate synthase-1/2/3 large subunit
MGVAATFMGKGVLDADDPHWRGTVGLQSRDYELAGFRDADVVITVGYDLVEHAPVNWNPQRDKRIVCIDTAPVEVDEYFMTASELIGDIDLIVRKLTGLCGTGEPMTTTPSALEELVGRAFEAGADDDAFPLHPPRALWPAWASRCRRPSPPSSCTRSAGW